MKNIQELSKDELIEVFELSSDLDNSHNEKLLELYNNETYLIYGEKVSFLTVVQLNQIAMLAEKEAAIRYISKEKNDTIENDEEWKKMNIYMVSYRNRGPAQKAVEAKNKEEAMKKFNAWVGTREDADDYSKALSASELIILN